MSAIAKAPRDHWTVTLDAPDDFDGWRAAARALIGAGVDPAHVVWTVAGEGRDLFAGSRALDLGEGPALTLPARFLPLARAALLHRDGERFALLHRLADGLARRRLHMADAADPLLRRVEGLAKSVRRDIHKMRAFVRFREVPAGEGTRFVAWFEPDHHIVRANAAFFVERFASMQWSILTPALCIHWDGKLLTESPGATKGDAPAGDPVEDIWKRYYASIFNPARVKIGAMMSEMPKKYWHNMPETALIPGLVAAAQARTRTMLLAGGEAARPARVVDAVPADGQATVEDRAAALAALADSARAEAVPEGPARYGDIVWGEGRLDAGLMLVGEQPGDQEDLAGRPFVGPAGQLLDRALREAGVDRSALYLTNAFKRFKHLPQGKRRLHQTPTAGEIDHARWWLDRERALVRPRLVLALGASAARGLIGKSIAVGKARGQDFTLADGARVRITLHPSAILRNPDADAAAQQFRTLCDDVRQAADLAGISA